MKNIAYVATDIQFTKLTEKDANLGLVFLNLYDLPYADLSAYAGIIITNFVEEEFLLEHKDLLEKYLDNQGVIFSQVEISLPWLPGCGNWARSPIPIKDQEFYLIEPAHPIFQHIEPYDLNFKKGVKGFFTRGFFDRIPKYAEVLVEDTNGEPVIYMDRYTTKGTIFTGAGTDLYRFGIQENSTKVLAEQMLRAIREEYDFRKSGGAI